MKNWVLGLSIGLNLVLLGVLVFLNERYGLLAKAERVVLQEARVPGIAAPYELNRNYQVRREMFRLDRNTAARVLMLGDSLTAQGEWNTMLGEPLVANRGIDGDTSAGVLARVGDDADFPGDAVVIWIGTNDVLQGGAAGPVAENIGKAVAELKGRTTKNTNRHETGKIIDGKIIGITEGEAGRRLDKPSGAAFSNPSTSELARDSENSSLTHFVSGPFFSPSTSYPLPATTPEAQVFVLGVAPMARWWEGARERNATIREINALLAEGAKGNGYQFIELESLLADENGFLRVDMTSDGVHLSAKGYVAVIEKMKNGPLRGR
jgi:lysophospholipase L1-like esterase